MLIWFACSIRDCVVLGRFAILLSSCAELEERFWLPEAGVSDGHDCKEAENARAVSGDEGVPRESSGLERDEEDAGAADGSCCAVRSAGLE